MPTMRLLVSKDVPVTTVMQPIFPGSVKESRLAKERHSSPSTTTSCFLETPLSVVVVVVVVAFGV